MERLFVTIVMYDRSWSDVVSSTNLEDAVEKKQIQLLIYDNSPQIHHSAVFCHPLVTYIHNPANPGLSLAYNKGYQMATSAGCEWMLLLDQDTELTASYLECLLQEDRGPEVGAVVPIVFSGNKQISPVLADRYINRYLSYPNIGIEKHRLMAINSGTAVSIAALDRIGGFNLRFPLDFLDHWLFFALYQEGYHVLVMDQSLEHDLSVMHYETMTQERYEQIISSESFFYQQYDKEKQQEHKKQLFFRTLKQCLSPSSFRFSKRTWQEYRLFRKDQT